MTPSETNRLKRDLKKEVQEALERVEITDWKVVKILKSRFTDEQYQGGAYIWKAILRHKRGIHTDSEILSFIPFFEIADALMKGKHIRITTNGRIFFKALSFSDLELTYS